ncbi:MAG: DUF2019 domain-containing protein [Patescibacteria group bacterium]|jgi:hypothetical protein
MTVGLNDLVNEYIEYAAEHGIGTEKGDYKKANKAYEKLMIIYHKIKENDPQFNLLLPLLKHDNPYVRLWSASHLLSSTKEAKKVLKQLMKQRGLASFDAKMTLQEWEKEN